MESKTVADGSSSSAVQEEQPELLKMSEKLKKFESVNDRKNDPKKPAEVPKKTAEEPKKPEEMPKKTTEETIKTTVDELQKKPVVKEVIKPTPDSSKPVVEEDSKLAEAIAKNSEASPQPAVATPKSTEMPSPPPAESTPEPATVSSEPVETNLKSAEEALKPAKEVEKTVDKATSVQSETEKPKLMQLLDSDTTVQETEVVEKKERDVEVVINEEERKKEEEETEKEGEKEETKEPSAVTEREMKTCPSFKDESGLKESERKALEEFKEMVEKSIKDKSFFPSPLKRTLPAPRDAELLTETAEETPSSTVEMEKEREEVEEAKVEEEDKREEELAKDEEVKEEEKKEESLKVEEKAKEEAKEESEVVKEAKKDNKGKGKIEEVAEEVEKKQVISTMVVEKVVDKGKGKIEEEEEEVVVDKKEVNSTLVVQSRDIPLTSEESIETSVEEVEGTTSKDIAVVKEEEEEEEEEEEVEESEPCLWGVPLLPSKGDPRTEVILLKFLRAREFQTRKALRMLKKTMAWRKKEKVDAIMDEEFDPEFKKISYMHGCDKKGHPVCYNSIGVFQDKELYEKALGEGKSKNFIRWRVQVMEEGVSKLDFKPDGINSLVQITDLKDYPGVLQTRKIVKKVFKVLQDNYPELLAKKIFINAPWYYLALPTLFEGILTPRQSSKAVYARPTKLTETLFEYISPAQVPVKYGGFSRPGDTEFEGVEAEIMEVTVMAGENKAIVFPDHVEASTLVWDVTILGWDVEYAEHFIPTNLSDHPRVITRQKMLGRTEEPIRSSFKDAIPGKVELTINNSTSKKKKTVVYRYLVK